MINVHFFAALREQLKCNEIKLNVASPITVKQAKQLLVEMHPNWQQFLLNNSLLTAVNHELVEEDYVVNLHDELAFFPPVTGG